VCVVEIPAIETLTKFFPALVQTEYQTYIDINGYGANTNFTVRVIAIDAVCAKCGECAATYTYDPCPFENNTCEHIWKNNRQYVICDVSKKTADAAWLIANALTAAHLRRVVKENPEFSAKFTSFLPNWSIL
jgi:hypothetical protein